MNPLGPFRSSDRALYRLMHGRLRARPLDPVMIIATDIGVKSAAWLAAASVLALFGDGRARRASVVTAASTLTAQAVVNVLMKPLFRRRRPFQQQRLSPRLLILPPRQPSWPSGHAASSAAALTTLSAAYPERTFPLFLLALIISYSRVYVGVHYPFDVAAGTAIGAAVGFAYSRLTGIRRHTLPFD